MCVLALALISNVHSKPTDAKLLKKAFLDFIRSMDSKAETRDVENRSEADYADDETVEARSYEASGESGEDTNTPLYLDEDGYPEETAEIVGSEELGGDSAVVIDIEIVDEEKRKQCVCTDGRPEGACQCKVRRELAAALEQKQRGKCVCTDGRPEGACQCKVSRELAAALEREQRGSDAVERSEKEELEERARVQEKACQDDYDFCPSVISTPCDTWDKENCAESCELCQTGTKHDAGCCRPGQTDQCAICDTPAKLDPSTFRREETLEQEQRGGSAVERSETEDLLRELKEFLEVETRNTQEDRAACEDRYGSWYCGGKYSWSCSSRDKQNCAKTCGACSSTSGGGGGSSTNTGSGTNVPTNVQCGIAPKYSTGNSQYIVGGSEADKNRYPSSSCEFMYKEWSYDILFRMRGFYH